MGTIQKNRANATEAHPSVKLNSWKEIASYLDRDPRTVQMWEKYEGLPVHRLTHRSRASVYAFSGELDAWLRGRRSPSAVELMDEAPPEPSGFSSTTLRHTYPYLFAAAALVVAGLLGGGLWAIKGHSTPRPAAPGMMVVLPFENQISSDDLLVDGLTDALIADLGKSGGIQVISRRSVMPFKGRHLPLPQIAAQLHASLVLQGTVAQVGDEWRVTVELLDAVQDRHLWGATYTRRTAEILSREDELASAIATEVTKKLTGAAPPVAFDSTKAANPQARQAYLTGRFFWNQRDLPGLEKAVSYFDRAIAIDPKYAPAYAGLADSYDLMTDRGGLPSPEAFHRAKAAAETALSLDPTSAEAYNALAVATCRQDWDFPAAEQDFKKAIELDPNYAVAHQWYGEFLGDLRRFDQSIAELKKAKELDPLSPMVGSDLADGYLHAGRYAEAEAELRRILDLYPEFVPAHRYLATVYIVESKFDQAEAEAQVYLQHTGDETLVQWVQVHRLVAAGKDGQAREQVRRLLGGRNAPAFNAYQKAGFFFATGQTEAAYAALQDAYRERSWWLVTMLVDPGFDGIRNQPRFQDLARRVGLPVEGAPSGGDATLASR